MPASTRIDSRLPSPVSSKVPSPVLFALVLAIAALLGASCLDSSSSDTVVREVGVNVAGTYTAQDGGALVSNNSGDEITSLNIRQSGSQLTGVDNNGVVYRGTIGNVSDTSASFNIEGAPGGKRAVISGTFNVSGDDATISGRWVEADTLGTINGSSSVANRTPDDDTTDDDTTDDGDDTDDGNDDDDDTTSALIVQPTGNQSLEVGQGRSFAATGGTGSFGWSLSNGTIGTLSQTSGNNTTYTATAAGNQTLTLRSGTLETQIPISQTEVETPDLTISPSGVQTVNTGETLSFTAAGGIGNYNWTLSNSTLGSLDVSTGASVVYTAVTNSSTFSVTVMSGDDSESVDIVQIDPNDIIIPPTP